jgi:hypothetical protein
MKKILITALTLTLITITASYFYFKNKQDNRLSIITQPLQIISLKENLTSQKINLQEACKNPNLVQIKSTHLSESEFKKRFSYLCEDEQLALILEENFNSNNDYKYFLNCAKEYATELQQVMKDLKEHYPEDYKNLNFKQGDVLLKYLKHPTSSYLMAQCESKTEALYWKSISQSNHVEDLKFCISTTEDCLSGKTKAEECPANFKNYHSDCTKKLNKMKSH